MTIYKATVSAQCLVILKNMVLFFLFPEKHQLWTWFLPDSDEKYKQIRKSDCKVNCSDEQKFQNLSRI